MSGKESTGENEGMDGGMKGRMEGGTGSMVRIQHAEHTDRQASGTPFSEGGPNKMILIRIIEEVE